MNRIFDKQELEKLLHDKLYEVIATRISREHPADVAEILEDLESDAQTHILSFFDTHTRASAISELDAEDREDLLESLGSEEISDLVDEMAIDDAADIVEELSKDKAQDVLRLLEPEDSEDIKEILSHQESSASRIMDPELLAVNESSTVGQTLKALRELDLENDDDIYFVYIVDYQNKLVGSVSLQSLIKNDESRPVGSIMNQRVISVFQDTDQEEVVQLVQKYNLVAIPVVDEEGKLKGRITVDDIIDVIEEETTEDIYRLVGFITLKEETRSRIFAAMLRLPWLIAALLGSLVGAYLQKRLQTPLGQEQFAIFGPYAIVIAAMGGNIGIQSCTTLVRGIATGDIEGRVAQAILREMAIAAMVGVVCAAIGGFWAYLTSHVWYISVVVGVSLFISIMIAASLGALAPATCNKIGIDPTVASGPVVTVSIDLICIVIYFLLAILAINTFS